VKRDPFHKGRGLFTYRECRDPFHKGRGLFTYRE
jgi:hypothetical protein